MCAVHPSPVASNFYDKAHKLDALAFFKNFAVTPDQLPKEMLRPIGRIVWYDIGMVAIAFRKFVEAVRLRFFATLISWTAHNMGDYKRTFNNSRLIYIIITLHVFIGGYYYD